MSRRGVSVQGSPPPLETPWTETPQDRDPMDRDPMDRDPHGHRDTCKKITLPQTSFSGGGYIIVLKRQILYISPVHSRVLDPPLYTHTHTHTHPDPLLR